MSDKKFTTAGPELIQAQPDGIFQYQRCLFCGITLHPGTNHYCPRMPQVAEQQQQPLDNILDEASKLVYGARNSDYGHPEEDYTRVGVLWGALLSEWVKQPRQEGAMPIIPPELACLMMTAVKMSRQVNKPKRDNLVDLAGYAACVHRIMQRKEGLE